jgi:hypothetical protein
MTSKQNTAYKYCVHKFLINYSMNVQVDNSDYLNALITDKNGVERMDNRNRFLNSVYYDIYHKRPSSQSSNTTKSTTTSTSNKDKDVSKNNLENELKSIMDDFYKKMNIELIQVQKYGKYDDGNDTVDENKENQGSNLEEGNNGDNENFEDSSNHTSEI